MASKVIATGSILLIMLAFCEPRPLLQESEYKTSPATAKATVVTPQASKTPTSETLKDVAVQNSSRKLITSACRASDIQINQGQISGVGLPVWQVEILNTCTNSKCRISNIIVQCGAFHSGGTLVNPKLFRRLDSNQGTCIANDGKTIGNAQTVSFQYAEIWKQSLTLRSAKVSCL